MLGIRDVTNAPFAPGHPVSDSVTRMAQGDGPNAQAGMQKQFVPRGKVADCDICPKRLVKIRHQRRCPTAHERLGDALRWGQMAAPDTKPRSRIIERHKERQAANMVEMGVA